VIYFKVPSQIFPGVILTIYILKLFVTLNEFTICTKQIKVPTYPSETPEAN